MFECVECGGQPLLALRLWTALPDREEASDPDAEGPVPLLNLLLGEPGRIAKPASGTIAGWLHLRSLEPEALEWEALRAAIATRIVSRPAGYTQEVHRLLKEIQSPATPPERRLEIGDELARIGDPRPGVGTFADPATGLRLSDIAWVEIPAGPFIYKKGERRGLPRYYLARYPVTNAQFQCFLDDPKGYADPAWWKWLPKQKQKAPH